MVKQTRKRNPRNCVVCDVRLRYNHHQTCGQPLCRAVTTLYPHIRDMERKQVLKQLQRYHYKPAGPGAEKQWSTAASYAIEHTKMLASQDEQNEALALGFAIDSSDWEIRDKYLSTDTRGVDSPEIQNEIWGYLSRRTVAWRCVARKDAEASLTIRLRKGETVSGFIRSKLASSSGSEELFEIFYAWRCTCPTRTELVYKTVDDLPQGPGYHHACVYCHASPLEVVIYE